MSEIVWADEFWERMRLEREAFIEAQSNRLLPCIRHGNKAAIEKVWEDELSIMAVECGCWVDDLSIWDSLEAAVDAWNERPVEDELRAEVARLTTERDDWQFRYDVRGETIDAMEESIEEMQEEINELAQAQRVSDQGANKLHLDTIREALSRWRAEMLPHGELLASQVAQVDAAIAYVGTGEEGAVYHGKWVPVERVQLRDGYELDVDSIALTLGKGNTAYLTWEWPDDGSEYALMRRVGAGEEGVQP